MAGVRVVMLDTEWWLHKTGPKPEGTAQGCADSGAVFDSVRALLARRRRKAYPRRGSPPARRGGEHGGYFGWKDYFFPVAPRGVMALASASRDWRGVSCRAECGHIPSGHVQPDVIAG
jgi:hypothetical protein